MEAYTLFMCRKMSWSIQSVITPEEIYGCQISMWTVAQPHQSLGKCKLKLWCDANTHLTEWCIIRTWHLWASWEPKFPALVRHAPIQREKLPTQLAPLSARPATPHPVHSLSGFISLLAHEVIQTSQSQPPTGAKGQSTLLSLQILCPTAPAGSLCSWVQAPCGPAWHMTSSSPELWVYVTNKLLSVSSVQC